ncbi:hypothetical protein D3C87_2196170 [compost metagenome]
MQSKIIGTGEFHPSVNKYPDIAIPASASATAVTTFAGLINRIYPFNFFNMCTIK